MRTLPTPISHYFLEEAGEYLEAHGFRRADSPAAPGSATYYLNGSKAVEIRGNKLEVAYYHPGDDDRKGEFRTLHTFTGIEQLDLFGFMLLFHLTGVATIRQLAKGAMQEGVRFNPDVVLNELFAHFKVTEDREAVPMNY